MKRLRWQLLIVFLAIIAIGVLLIEDSPELAPEIIEPQPVTGGVYSEALVGEFGRLNPVLDTYNPVDQDINRLLYRGLIHFDGQGLPQADLAESWGISQDGTTYNFSIRPQAKWHDGTPVTSQDIQFTVDLMRSDTIPLPEDVRALWDQVDVNQLDDQTLQFILPEPFAPFLDFLAFGVLPSHILGELSPTEVVDAEFNLNPIGNGPYRFSRLITQEGQITGVVLEVFEDFYAEIPFITEFVFRYYSTDEQALAAYQSGEVMGIGRVSDGILQPVLAEPGLNLYTVRQPQLTLILFNLQDPELPFFQNTSIRRALLMGLNRQWIIDQVLGGQAFIADGPIFPGTWAYYEGLEQVPYNPESALDIIRQAGYSLTAGENTVRQNEGVEFAFTLLHPDTPKHQAIAEIIRQSWSQLNIGVALEAVPYDTLVSEHLEPRAFQAVLIDLNLSRSPDPDPYPFWDQAQITGGQNYSGWDDRQASEYLERARITTDIGERAKAYRNFQVRFVSELPAAPLFYPVYSFAVDDQVQGISLSPIFSSSDRFNNVNEWYLEAERFPVEGFPTGTVIP